MRYWLEAWSLSGARHRRQRRAQHPDVRMPHIPYLQPGFPSAGGCLMRSSRSGRQPVRLHVVSEVVMAPVDTRSAYSKDMQAESGASRCRHLVAHP